MPAVVGFLKLLVPKTIKQAAVVLIQAGAVIVVGKLINKGIEKSRIIDRTKSWFSKKEQQPAQTQTQSQPAES